MYRKRYSTESPERAAQRAKKQSRTKAVQESLLYLEQGDARPLCHEALSAKSPRGAAGALHGDCTAVAGHKGTRLGRMGNEEPGSRAIDDVFSALS